MMARILVARILVMPWAFNGVDMYQLFSCFHQGSEDSDNRSD